LTQRRGFRYLADLRVTRVSPPFGPLAGGTVVTLQGTGFTGATEVRFGTVVGTALTTNNDNELSVTSPAGASGAIDLTVVTPRGTWTMKRGFSYVDAAGPLALFAVSPRIVNAGDQVTLVGQGLDAAGLTVTIGGVAATVGAQTATSAVVTVPARAAAPRRSDVVVTGATSVTLTEGITWRVALRTVSPVNASCRWQHPRAGAPWTPMHVHLSGVASLDWGRHSIQLPTNALSAEAASRHHWTNDCGAKRATDSASTGRGARPAHSFCSCSCAAVPNASRWPPLQRRRSSHFTMRVPQPAPLTSRPAHREQSP